MLFCHLLTFFLLQNKLLKKFFRKHYPSVIGFRSRAGPTFLIRVQTVCKGYQHSTKVTASKERVMKGDLVQQLSFSVCMLGNIACFLSSAEIFQKKTNRNTYHLSIKQFVSRSDPTFFLGPNCLERLSADDTSR